MFCNIILLDHISIKHSHLNSCSPLSTIGSSQVIIKVVLKLSFNDNLCLTTQPKHSNFTPIKEKLRYFISDMDDSKNGHIKSSHIV